MNLLFKPLYIYKYFTSEKYIYKNTEFRGKFQKVKFLIKWQNQELKQIKRIEQLFFPDLIQALSYVINGGLNLVLELAKPLTCMTVASNSIVLTTMYEQNKQT